MSKELNFEEKYNKLEEAVNKLSSNLSLEEAINAYNEGLKYYKECETILDQANQKIEIIKED
ncbi:MAG: exodeoxyribonuclease VII small subunit [Clostridia bacterium]|nr:exodeoxyribonuclease VII small subunit [Clostridia bacterium]